MQVIAEQTGLPVGQLLGDAAWFSDLHEHLSRRVLGQGKAIRCYPTHGLVFVPPCEIKSAAGPSCVTQGIALRMDPLFLPKGRSLSY
jgi:hypothetical protein